MNTNELLIPAYFTNREGGKWLPYSGNGFTRNQLDKAVTGFLSRHSSVPFEDQIVLTARVEDTNFQIHSIIFGPVTGTDAYKDYARWDTHNGWTTEL